MNPAGEYTFFSTEETPPQQVFFGDGSRKQLGDLASKYGKKILLEQRTEETAQFVLA